jgi:hypothetical protein
VEVAELGSRQGDDGCHRQVSNAVENHPGLTCLGYDDERVEKKDFDIHKED